VKFIFATTDAHKVPETIHSRCQHYDFRRLTNSAIAGSLSEICAKEGVIAGEGLLEAIAAICDGGMRDAQSKLDQLIAFRGEKLAVADLEDVFGLVGRANLLALVRAFRAGDTRRALETVDSLFTTGKDLASFTTALAGMLRDLLLVKACGSGFRGVELMPGEAESLSAEAEHWSADSLVYAVDLLGQASQRLRGADFPRFVLEAAAVRLCSVRELARVSDLVAALDAAATAAPAPRNEPTRQTAPAPRPTQISSPPPPAQQPAQPSLPQRTASVQPAAPVPRSPEMQRARDLINEVFSDTDAGR
jgi:DNA polymerase-3 subunit gamma/tau